MDTIGSYIYGGDIYGEEKKVFIEGEEIDLSSFDKKTIIKIIDYTQGVLEKISNDCEVALIKKSSKEYIIKLCNNLLNENKRIKDVIDSLMHDKSSQYQELIIDIYLELFDNMVSYASQEIKINQDTINFFREMLSSLYGKIKNIPKLSIISKSIDKGIVVFGKNGSGKSKFMSFLMKVYHNNMVLIPAQKILYFSKRSVNITNDENDISNMHHKNLLDSINDNNFDLHGYSNNFTLLISHIAKRVIEEQNKILNEILQKKKKNYKDIEIKIKDSLLSKINEIWNKIIPNIIFKLDTKDYCIYPYNTTSGNSYSINHLSDGEKVILYYICNVLLAGENEFIIIDEPETYLNPALYIEVWNLLERIRPDCKFIYISHELDFIKSRNNHDLFWMKKYIYPDNWDFIQIEDILNIPNDLIIDIYGSKNKILFCEGEVNSKDYKIYYALFHEKYTIIPVNGCHNVIEYTKSINNTISQHGKSAVGIIDNDNRSPQKIAALKKQKIYVTSFNEIEMLLCDRKILEKATQYLDEKESNNKIERFIEDFYKTVNKNKEKIAFSFIRESINYKLETYKLNSKKASDIESELQNQITKLNINNDYNNYIAKINDIINKKDYYNLMKICNLKDEIVKGLGNKHINNDFSEMAIGIITKDLKTHIKNTYFNGFEEL